MYNSIKTSAGVILALMALFVALPASAYTELTDIFNQGTCTVGGTCSFLGFNTTARSWAYTYKAPVDTMICGVKIKIERNSTNPLSQTDLDEDFTMIIKTGSSRTDPHNVFTSNISVRIGGDKIPYLNEYTDNLIPFTTILPASASNCFFAGANTITTFETPRTTSGSYLMWAKNFSPTLKDVFNVSYSDNITTFASVSKAFEPTMLLQSPTTIVFNPSYFNKPVSSSWGFTDSDFGWLGNMLIDILRYLFVPNQQALNNFNQLANDLMLKPPFAYFTAIKNAILGLQNGTATETLDISPIQALITPIRTGFIWILWFAFAFWLLKRFMHIQL